MQITSGQCQGDGDPLHTHCRPQPAFSYLPLYPNPHREGVRGDAELHTLLGAHCWEVDAEVHPYIPGSECHANSFDHRFTALSGSCHAMPFTSFIPQGYTQPSQAARAAHQTKGRGELSCPLLPLEFTQSSRVNKYDRVECRMAQSTIKLLLPQVPGGHTKCHW